MRRVLMRFGGIFDIDKISERINDLEQMSAMPEFWQDKKRSTKLLKEKSALERRQNSFQQLIDNLEEAETLLELAEEEQVRQAQLEALASLGRPWVSLKLERQSTLYFLRVHELDSGKLHRDVKENQCIGIAPLR